MSRPCRARGQDGNDDARSGGQADCCLASPRLRTWFRCWHRAGVVSEKFSKSRRRGWSWYAGDWAITGSFGRMHTMTKRQGKSGTIDIKAVLAEDEEFLRALVRMALQEVLEAEMTEALGAEKGERASGRQGYRSGYYGRTLITRVGKLELRVPQDRTGRFSTELFERYQRSERALVAA